MGAIWTKFGQEPSEIEVTRKTEAPVPPVRIEARVKKGVQPPKSSVFFGPNKDVLIENNPPGQPVATSSTFSQPAQPQPQDMLQQQQLQQVQQLQQIQQPQLQVQRPQQPYGYAQQQPVGTYPNQLLPPHQQLQQQQRMQQMSLPAYRGGRRQASRSRRGPGRGRGRGPGLKRRNASKSKKRSRSRSRRR